MGLVEDFGAYLLYIGCADYLLGTQPHDDDRWGLGYGFLPPQPSQIVLLREYAGAPSAVKIQLDYPGLQVSVRAKRNEYSAAADRIYAIYRALDGLGPIVWGDNSYRSVQAQQSGFLDLGYDGQDVRPQLAWNFIVWRTRNE